jgi:hypothetical protein
VNSGGIFKDGSNKPELNQVHYDKGKMEVIAERYKMYEPLFKVCELHDYIIELIKKGEV